MFLLKYFRIYPALLICLALTMASCGGGGSGGSGSSTPSPTPIPTVTPTPGPTPTPTPTPIPTPTPTPTGEVPGGGVSIINTNMANASFWGGDNGGSAVGSRQTINVVHEEFSQATRITVSNPTGEFWNGQLSFPINTNLSAGDAVLIHLYFRSVENTYESGNAFATVFIENAEFDKYITREVSAAAEWQEYYLPAEITANEAATQLVLKVGFGGGDRAQVFDVAGIELLNYGSSLEVADLPATLPSYEGREPDAEWRAAAAARIEQHRKGDFQLTVLDAENAPAENATVAVRFKKHAYHFGSVTVGNRLMGTGTDNETYREKVLELFNQSGPENDLKWGPWAGEWGSDFSQQTTLNGLQWLRDNGLYTRGHVLVWPSKRNLPELIQEYLPEDPADADEQALQIVLDHIDDITLATADYLDEWDVLNEPYDNHYLMDAFGDQIMVDWFNRARTNLPSHGLYLNDYGILSAGGRNLAHQQHFEDTIQYLVDNDAPITGMGMQSHFGESPTSIPLIYSVLERYHTAFPNLAIRSTEFDVNTTDEEMQADFTRDFVTIFFSHPATVGVQLWGFWAGAHWTPNAAFYTQDWQEKPNALAWKELIYSDWWNDFDGQTDAQGIFSERGFYGEYEVTVTIGEESRVFEFDLSAEGTNEFEFSFAD